MPLTSREIANISTLTALSVVMMLIGFEYSFIYLPYLKFDVAEIPVYMIALLFGTVPTIISTIIITLVIAIRNPIGALFKFLAIFINGVALSSLVTLIKKKSEKNGPSSKTINYLILVGLVSIIIRSIALTIANYYLIAILWGPIEQIASFYGYTVSLLLLLTFVFNIIQGIINVIGAILITSKLPPEWVPDWLRH